MVKVNNLTWLSTISSARIPLFLHPPPMRSEISLPTIRKQGEMRVPKRASGESVCSRPAGSLSLGRFSAPPYPPVPLLLGAFSAACFWIIAKCWLVNESSACHFPSANSIFKVKAAGYIKNKKRKRKKKWNCHPPEYPMVTFGPLYSFAFNYLYRSMRQWTLKDIYNEIHYQCIQLDMCLCWNRDCCRMDSDQDKMNSYY